MGCWCLCSGRVVEMLFCRVQCCLQREERQAPLLCVVVFDQPKWSTPERRDLVSKHRPTVLVHCFVLVLVCSATHESALNKEQACSNCHTSSVLSVRISCYLMTIFSF